MSRNKSTKAKDNCVIIFCREKEAKYCNCPMTKISRKPKIIGKRTISTLSKTLYQKVTVKRYSFSDKTYRPSLPNRPHTESKATRIFMVQDLTLTKVKKFSRSKSKEMTRICFKAIRLIIWARVSCSFLRTAG